MVNQENMQRWVDALRSGEYTQIRGTLESPAGNCAMGVACREAIKAGVPIEVLRPNKMADVTLFDGTGGNLPASVRRWLGFTYSADLRVTEHGRSTVSIADANDFWRWSFAEIADALYARYLKEPDNG